ncbi:unnamed protein product [Coregonus sp. 'balchen']|nr:unnamed protein product [Coregonus sp. 'balchen']
MGAFDYIKHVMRERVDWRRLSTQQFLAKPQAREFSSEGGQRQGRDRDLRNNLISTVEHGAFRGLMALRRLHFSTESLFCDCQLEWLLPWARANGVRLGNDTLCVHPTHLHGLEVRNLRETQLRCDGPLELPLFQLIPSQRQVVFRGDRLPLQCTVSYLDPSVTLLWRHNGHVVHSNEDRGVYVEDTLVHDCCLLTGFVAELIVSKYEDE